MAIKMLWYFYCSSTATTDFIGQTLKNVTFAPSETEKTVNVTVVNDDTFENTEGFIAMLSAAPGSTFRTGATGIATANIIDDDSKPSAVLGVSWQVVKTHPQSFV